MKDQLRCPNCGCGLTANVSVSFDVAATTPIAPTPGATKLEELALPRYTVSCLRYRFEDVDQLCDMTPVDLLRVRGVGRRRLTEVRVALALCGRHLATDRQWFDDWNRRNGGAA